jgi:hypothetical protein
MEWSEKFNEFYEQLRLSIINKVGEIGIESKFSNEVVVAITNKELQFNLGEDKYLTEVGCYSLFDNEGYTYSFGQIDVEELCQIADFINI